GAGRGGEGVGGGPMMDVTVNIPEVVAEVRALFERYEQALIDKNVEVLDATFSDSPHTIRYAFSEHRYGFAQIHAPRLAPRPARQGEAAPPRGPHARPRPGHGESRVQGAWSGRDRSSEPDVGALPRPRLEGRQRARLGDQLAAHALIDLHGRSARVMGGHEVH